MWTMIVVGGILALPVFVVLLVQAILVILLIVPAAYCLKFRKSLSFSSSRSPKGSSNNTNNTIINNNENADTATNNEKTNIINENNNNRRRMIITGGSSGIGLALAVDAAQRAVVMEINLLARDVSRLEHAAAIVQQHVTATTTATTTTSGKSILIRTFSVDVSDYDALKHVMEQIFEPTKEHNDCYYTHVFCCAGEAAPHYHQNISPDVFARHVQINQLGSIYTAQTCLPHMQAGGITFCSSIGGQIGVFGFAAYCPTKFAIRGYAEVLHMELINRPIYVQVAFPPDTDTPGYAKELAMDTRPIETARISATAGLADPAWVARIMMQNSVCCSSGTDPPFSVSFTLEGYLVSIVSAGFAPAPTISEILLQVAGMSLIRLLSLFFLQDWYRIIRDCQKNPAQPPPPVAKTPTTQPLLKSTVPNIASDMAKIGADDHNDHNVKIGTNDDKMKNESTPLQPTSSR